MEHYVIVLTGEEYLQCGKSGKLVVQNNLKRATRFRTLDAVKEFLEKFKGELEDYDTVRIMKIRTVIGSNGSELINKQLEEEVRLHEKK